MGKIAAFLQKAKSSASYQKATSSRAAQAVKDVNYKKVGAGAKVSAAYGSVAVIGGITAYGLAKSAKNAISETFFEPYDMTGVRNVGMEGSSPNETMLFAPTLRETARQGLKPGQFADTGDLALSLNKLRRG